MTGPNTPDASVARAVIVSGLPFFAVVTAVWVRVGGSLSTGPAGYCVAVAAGGASTGGYGCAAVPASAGAVVGRVRLSVLGVSSSISCFGRAVGIFPVLVVV